MWKFYLSESEITRRDLLVTALEHNLKIATQVRGKKIYAVVDGAEDYVKIFYQNLREKYTASPLKPYRGLQPNFEEELAYANLQATVESTNLLKGISERTEKLAALADELANLPVNVRRELSKDV